MVTIRFILTRLYYVNALLPLLTVRKTMNLLAAIFLFLIKEEKNGTDRIPLIFEKVIFYLAVLLCFANIIAAFFECYLGPCCENGPCP